MPYKSEKEFAEKHNKKLRGKAATTAMKQEQAMERAGVPVGTAMATANKTGNRMMRRKK